MTNIKVRCLLFLSGFSSLAAYAQQPPDVVITDAYGNTASGTNALLSVQGANGGANNSAFGGYALQTNTIGLANTATGSYALFANTTGTRNDAHGRAALGANTTGYDNIAVGVQALGSNTTGWQNTAVGRAALYFSTTGNYNSATGAFALQNNTTGSNNTSAGFQALDSNTTASNNTALGYDALYKNKTGAQSTALGSSALYAATGGFNTAVGYEALKANTSGKYNVSLGWEAGLAVTTGSNNIDIGNPGLATDGVTADSGVIRIGTQSPTALQTSTYIAGIYDNTSVAGIAVVIDSNGQLGTVSSSERFKTDIAPMGANTAKLQDLRPVTFHYRADSQGTLRYGLIAEEVAKVYPELVVRDTNGRIDGVRYDELAPMLLNEMQKQQQQIALQYQRAASQDAKISQLQEQLTEMRAALLKIESKEQLVAQR